MNEDDTTHFGFESVAAKDKGGRVREVFESVAPNYDLMNDLMSLGLHRSWKRFTVDVLDPRPGEQVLDLAAGTGDLARLISRRLRGDGLVIVADINPRMLAVGRDRLLDQGICRGVGYVLADAESLPWAAGSFDCVSIAFGLRNVTRMEKALAEMFRVLRPGGRLGVLEFSQLRCRALRPAYDAYSFAVLPRLGQAVAGDSASYRYLAQSIRRHPGQDELLGMLATAGFEHCTVRNLTGGVVALHRGYKL